MQQCHADLAVGSAQVHLYQQNVNKINITNIGIGTVPDIFIIVRSIEQNHPDICTSAQKRAKRMY